MTYIAWASAASGVVALLTWTRLFEPGWLIGAAALAGAALVADRLARTTPAHARASLVLGLGALGLALALAGVGVHRFRAIAYDWERLEVDRHRRLTAVLHERMAEIVAAGRAGAAAAAAAAAASAAPAPSFPAGVDAALFAELEALRSRLGIEAVAVFTDAGDLHSWAGEHRGGIPEPVRSDAIGPFFAERPLFSYLYFTAPVVGRDQHVVAAVLVETGVLAADDADAVEVTGTVAAGTDLHATFRAGPPRGGPAAWSLVEGGDTVAHALLEEVSQSAVRGEVETLVRRSVVLAALLALLLLSIGWIQLGVRPAHAALTAAPLLVWVAALSVAPIGSAFGLNRVLGPAAFVLPLPGDFTLGTLLAVLLPLGALVATYRSRGRDGRGFGTRLLVGTVAVAVAYPLLSRLLLDASATRLLQGGARLWLGLQFAGALLLGVVAALALPRRSRPADVGAAGDRQRAALLSAAGLAVAGLLALLVHAGTDVALPRRTWPTALWVAPFTLFAVGLASRRGASATLMRWLAAGWLGATAMLPGLWASNQAARLEWAERELTSLGVQQQPIQNFLLTEFGAETARRAAAGEEGIQLLYRSWVASGLANESNAARIAIWSPADTAEVELSLGAVELDEREAAVVRGIMIGARDNEQVPDIQSVVGLPNVIKVLTAPLGDGRMLTAALPPRRTIERTSVVAPFLGTGMDADVRLNLVESPGLPPTDTVEWKATGRGWESEAVVRFPEGDYHAHMDVRVPSLGMQLARALLLIGFDLALFALLWAAGNAARGVPPVPRGGWTVWLGSFRARVTLALFLFFVGPTVVFGWIAYRALAREVDRTARTVAERAVRQAVIEFPDSDGDLGDLATHAGSEILYYYNSGELAQVSSPEALELGIYGAWIAPSIFQQLATMETNTVQDVQRLGRNSFLLAYRRLRPAGILAVPMSLSSGDAAVRQRELAHIVAFAVLVGGVLSLALSVLVGRQLAGPIGQLRRAATAVGAGRLRVRLPEPPGEFGQLFAAFNRMVRRLRRARSQELRSARVLAWGEMARQVAHEIKNPLTPIKLSVQHLRRAYRDRRPHFDEILESNVDQILIEIDRLSEIARAFSRYGAPDAGEQALAAVDVAGVVQEALTLYRAADPAIAYNDRIEHDLPAAHARADELKEVVLNLVENARAALDGTGSITVSAARDDGAIALDVADDGPGIPPDLLPRIFEPHFSTRSAGTGLGLAIVRRIVEGWGGTVVAESERGRGTVVRVRIRAFPDDAASPP